MATADKAKQQLLNSMRKSKAGAASKPKKATRSATTKKAAARQTTQKSTSRSATRGETAIASATMKAVTQQQSSSDPYQSAGRIWPD